MIFSLQSIKELGAIPIDYNSSTVKDQLIKEAPFDLIIDCAESPLTEWSDSLLGAWRNCVHLSLVSPLMTNMDRYGLPLGLATTAGQLLCRNFEVYFDVEKENLIVLELFERPSLYVCFLLARP